LFALIEQIKRRGVGIIYISHRLNENRRIGDRITVLRDGRRVATLAMDEADDERLLQLMTGRVITQIFSRINFSPGAVVLEVDGVTTADDTVRNVSLEVRAGEVVGRAGWVGCGKSEVGRSFFGLEPIAAGNVRFDGGDTTGATPRHMLHRG